MGKLVRMDENVPSAFVSESRDFQVMTRLLTAVVANTKYFSDGIRYLNTPEYCSDRMIPLLSSKVGFFTDKDFSTDELRKIQRSFYYITRNKGDIQSITECINLYLRINRLDTIYYLFIDNENYSVNIGILTSEKNFDVMYETLKYCIPVGYFLNIFYYTTYDSALEFYNHGDVTWITSSGLDGYDYKPGEIISIQSEDDFKTLLNHYVDTGVIVRESNYVTE